MMKYMLKIAVLACLYLAAASLPLAAEEAGSAAENSVASGLAVGDSTLSFTVMDITGKYKGKRICYVCEYQDLPSVIGFFKDTSDDTAQMIVKLNKLYQENKDRTLKAFAVIVSGPEAGPWLEQLNQSQNIEIPLVLLKKGPKDLAVRLYHLNTDLANTFLVDINREVKANFSDITPAEFDQVADAATEMLAQNDL